MLARLAFVLRWSDLDLLRLFVGAYTAIFGLWILLPPPFSINQVTRNLERLAPLSIWGWAILLLGFSRIAGVACRMNGQRRTAFLTHSFAQVLLWGFISVWGYIGVDLVSIPAIVPLNVLIAAANIWLFLRLVWDYRFHYPMTEETRM